MRIGDDKAVSGGSVVGVGAHETLAETTAFEHSHLRSDTRPVSISWTIWYRLG
jgi:hypothetical protein